MKSPHIKTPLPGPKAKAMLDRLGVVRPEVQKVLDRLTGIPVDIEPKFTTAAQLTGR